MTAEGRAERGVCRGRRVLAPGIKEVGELQAARRTRT